MFKHALTSNPDIIREKRKGFTSWLEIDLDNLGYNLKQIQERVGVTVMAVVKNNAYGHGLIPVTKYLEEQGVEWVMVAKLYEAVMIREAGLSLNILCMDALFTEEQYRSVVKKGITQTIYTKKDAETLNEVYPKSLIWLPRLSSRWILVSTGLEYATLRLLLS